MTYQGGKIHGVLTDSLTNSDAMVVSGGLLLNNPLSFMQNKYSFASG